MFSYAPIAFVVIDYITGVIVTALEIGFRGIFKKTLIFVLLGISHIIDTNVIQTASVVRTDVSYFTC
jgi:phage-related holin